MKLHYSSAISLLILFLTGCYTIEDADDVNQERINATYCTEYNGTRGSMKTRIDFRFGQTPLRMDHPVYFEKKRLYEEQDILSGLHYGREINEVVPGTYEWTDEQGTKYWNHVDVYTFNINERINKIRKNRSYDFPWFGDEIPYSSESFSISVHNEEGQYVMFNSGKDPRIDEDDLDFLTPGPATLTISRNHSEPVDEGTQAGGRSIVSYELEYEIEIIN